MTAAAVRPRWSLLRRGLRYLERVLALLGLAFLIYFAGFDLSQVVSPSMAPTLQGHGEDDGDWVLTEKVSYWFRRPRRWEVVAFRAGDGMQVMKRVVGLPGERVSLSDGKVAIGGTVVPCPPALAAQRYLGVSRLGAGRSAECCGGYFVLGDDTHDSQDSRFEPPMDPRRLRGRAWLIVWPWRRAGWVGP